MKLLFTRSNGFVSRIIRWVTWHNWSHVALTDGTTVWECAHRVGCVQLPYQNWISQHSGDEVFEVEIEVDEVAVKGRADSRVGAAYDYLGLLGYLFRHDTDSSSRLSCSEYLSWVLNYQHQWFIDEHDHRRAPRHLFIAAYAKEQR